MATRSPDDAESLAPVLGVVGAAEKISDAAGDIAKVVLEDVGLPDAMRTALPEAVETLVRAEVAEGSPLAGVPLGELNLETETGVRVLAVRVPAGPDDRGDWQLQPDRETLLEPGQSAILRGPESGIREVYEDLTGQVYDAPEGPEPGIDDLERAVDSIVLMKNTSELGVDLAYGSVLFDSEDVAREVVALEAEVDALKDRLEAWTLRAAARVEDPIALRGLVRLASSTEVISDAAVEISEGVLRGLGTHPVIAEAVYESDEVIVRTTVRPGSVLAGATVGNEEIKTRTGMRVIGVHRADEEGSSEGWVVSPGPRTRLGGGDVLLAKGTRTGSERLAELASDDVGSTE
jgi:uncharacterized protein with PhoU and TrkA domain